MVTSAVLRITANPKVGCYFAFYAFKLKINKQIKVSNSTHQNVCSITGNEMELINILWTFMNNMISKDRAVTGV